MNKGFFRAGAKLLSRRVFSRPEKFEGNAQEICAQIVDKAWNGQFYQTGLGHFNYFWARDFGIVVESLIKSGNIDRVKKTVGWAMSNYARAGKIALCINKHGDVFDAPKKSIDALPWLLYSISKSKYKLSARQKLFLEKEISRFQKDFINPDTGDVLDGVTYSELRDAVDYKKSSYTVMMLYILADYSRKLGLTNFKHNAEIYRQQLEGYWNGDFFSADVETQLFSAESSLLPFFLGVIDDKKKLDKILAYIKTAKINQPFPMKYTDTPEKFQYHLWSKVIMPNYAGSTVWTWMGAIYLLLLKKTSNDDFDKQLGQFNKIIDRYKNFPELLHPDGEWYEVPLYRGDEGMIWAALLL